MKTFLRIWDHVPVDNTVLIGLIMMAATALKTVGGLLLCNKPITKGPEVLLGLKE